MAAKPCQFKPAPNGVSAWCMCEDWGERLGGKVLAQPKEKRIVTLFDRWCEHKATTELLAGIKVKER